MPIVLHLRGGLGNQLFQYATAKSLATQRHMDLILDDSWFDSIPKTQTPRTPMLGDLLIPEKLSRYRRTLPKHYLIQKLALFFPRSNESIIHQANPFLYDDSLFSDVLLMQRNYFLIGYWQSFKYFEKNKPQLQEILKSRTPLPDHYALYLKQIKSSDATMVHIRRGDYITSKKTNSYHGALPLSYYLKSMGQILEWHPKTHFFVFSDDISWAINSLPKKYNLTFVQSAPGRDSTIPELTLMTQCKHHIIANSSLSWWAAWLSDANLNQKVITPSRWTNKHEANLDDLIPPSWVKISP